MSGLQGFALLSLSPNNMFLAAACCSQSSELHLHFPAVPRRKRSPRVNLSLRWCSVLFTDLTIDPTKKSPIFLFLFIECLKLLSTKGKQKSQNLVRNWLARYFGKYAVTVLNVPLMLARDKYKKPFKMCERSNVFFSICFASNVRPRERFDYQPSWIITSISVTWFYRGSRSSLQLMYWQWASVAARQYRILVIWTELVPHENIFSPLYFFHYYKHLFAAHV